MNSFSDSEHNDAEYEKSKQVQKRKNYRMRNNKKIEELSQTKDLNTKKFSTFSYSSIE